jgi:hypothetical protein
MIRFLANLHPQTLSATEEHKIHTRKWISVILLILGGVLLAGRVSTVPMSVSYALLFLGHAGMFHQMYLKRDVPLALVNVIWLLVDVLGMIRWWTA